VSDRHPSVALRLAHATVVALVLPAAALSAACSRREASVAAAPIPVTVAVAEARDFPVELRAIGSVEALATVAVRPQVSGQLQQVHFREGADVQQGDLLFTIDPRPFEAALAQAEAALARDVAQARNAEAEARRAEDLFGQGVLSREQHDALHTSSQALAATVRADEANVQNARLQLAYCTIRAPLSGRTGSLLVKAGNVVQAVSGGPLVVINQVDPIYVSFTIPEPRLPEVTAASAARRLAVRAVVGSDEARPLDGELTFLDNEVDRGTGTVRLKAAFANPERRLWPGQYVSARLTVDVRRGAIVVPAEAVQDGQSGRYAYVMKPDRTVEVRNLVVGAAREGELVIEQGLAAGETVVTDGQLRLAPGAKVEPKPVAEPKRS
jgi:membrane fusion protein, multidrug efflux system